MSDVHDAGRMRCDQVLDELWAYIDGELTPESNEQMRAHLEKCAGCLPHYDYKAAFTRFVKQHASTPVPPGLRRKVFEMLLEEEKRQRAG